MVRVLHDHQPRAAAGPRHPELLRIGDREDLSYEEKLAGYRELADAYFEVDRYRDFCDSWLAHVDELVLDWITSAEFDRLLVRTVRETYLPHEHERFMGHFRGLIGQWVKEATATLSESEGRGGPRRSERAGCGRGATALFAGPRRRRAGAARSAGAGRSSVRRSDAADLVAGDDAAPARH